MHSSGQLSTKCQYPRGIRPLALQMRCSDQWSEQRCDPVKERRPLERATPGTLLLVLLAVLLVLLVGLVLLLSLVLVGLVLGGDCQLPAAGDTTSVEAGVVLDEELPLPIRVSAVECREGNIPIRNRSGSRKVVASRLIPRAEYATREHRAIWKISACLVIQGDRQNA